MAAALLMGLLGAAAMVGLEYLSAPAALKPVPIRAARPPQSPRN